MDGEKVYHAYSMPKKAGVTMLISHYQSLREKVFPEVNGDIS